MWRNYNAAAQIMLPILVWLLIAKVMAEILPAVLVTGAELILIVY